MKVSTCFSSGTMRRSISNCCFRFASCRSMSFNLGRYDSSSLFSRTFSCIAFCASAFLSLWLLNMVKYSATVTSAPPASNAPHCFRPDSSLQFFDIGPALRLSLLAGQRELKRLHVLDLIVLEGFLNFHVREETRLLQVCNQVRDRVGAQRRAFQAYARAGVIHLAQPDRFRSIHRLAQHRQKIDRPGLASAQRIDHVHTPLVVIGLSLPLQVARFHVAEFAVFLLVLLHLLRDRLCLPVQPPPVATPQKPGHQQHHQHLQLGRTHVAHFHRGHHRAAAAAGALVFSPCTFEQIDSDHRDSKLLKARPTATASWPGFCSTSSAPGPSVGGTTR